MLEALDQPWVKSESLAALDEYWHGLSYQMDQWAYNTNAGFLPPNPNEQPGE